jgi:RNA polymerase primary sigma factor
VGAKATKAKAKGRKTTKKSADEARAAAIWDAAPAITEKTKVVLTSKAGKQPAKPTNPEGRLRVPVAGFAVKKRVAKKAAKQAKEEALENVPVADRIEVLKELKGAKGAKGTKGAAEAEKPAKEAKKKKPRKPRKRRATTKRKDSDPGDMDSNLINSYLKEVSRHNLLTQQEEKDLARAIRRDDNSARQRLIQSNLRLVVKMAKKYVKKGVSLLDLIQEGNRGLMMAVEKYDPEKGFRFTTYASWWIKQALIRTIANQSRVIRLPVHMNETIARIKKTARILSLQLGRTPRTAEIAEYIQMPEEKVDYALQANKDTISMDYAKNSTEEAGTLNYFLENKNVPRPEDVIKNKLLKIGSEFGVTRERIRQIEAKALRQLRHPSRSHKLQDFY